MSEETRKPGPHEALLDKLWPEPIRAQLRYIGRVLDGLTKRLGNHGDWLSKLTERLDLLENRERLDKLDERPDAEPESIVEHSDHNFIHGPLSEPRLTEDETAKLQKISRFARTAYVGNREHRIEQIAELADDLQKSLRAPKAKEN